MLVLSAGCLLSGAGGEGGMFFRLSTAPQVSVMFLEILPTVKKKTKPKTNPPKNQQNPQQEILARACLIPN